MAQSVSATWQSIMSGEHWFESKLSIFSNNLLNNDEISAYGYGISVTDGSEVSASAYRTTGYMPVTPGHVYYFGFTFNGATAVGLAFYDSSKTFISSLSNQVMLNMNGIATAPAGAAYMRATISTGANPQYATKAFVNDYGQNLFNPNTVGTAGTYVNPANGNIVNGSSSYTPSDYIEVKPDTAYYFGTRNLSGNAGFAWYDESKTYIIGTTLTQLNTDKKREVSPHNAKYLRWTIVTTTNADWQYMSYVCAGNPNLLNISTIPDENKYITSGYGTTAAPTNPNINHWRHSDYIPVTAGVQYYFGYVNATASSAGIAWYRSNRAYISGMNDTDLGTANHLATAPANAAFLRLSFSIDNDYNPNWEKTVYLLPLETPVRYPHKYDYDETKIHSISTSNGLFGDNPTIGGCGSGELSFSVTYNNENVMRMAKCVPYVRCCSESQQSEWIQKGEYFIDERTMTKYQGGYQTLNAHCYDAMLKAGANYPSSTLTWPTADINVVTEIANALGIPVDARTTALMNKAYQISLPASTSMRDVLSYIGTMYGANTIISDEGKLLMIPLSGGSDSHSLGDGVMQLDYGNAQPPYTKVVYIVTNDLQASAGAGDDRVLEVYNPWGSASMANDCLNAVSGFQYQPFTASGAIIDPAFEIGDAVTISGITSHIYTASTEFSRLMLASIAAPLTVDVDHEYQYIYPSEQNFRKEMQNMSASISLNSQQIQTKVSSGEIISTINQSAEAVTINANKINLVGAVAVGTTDQQSIVTVQGPDSTAKIKPYGIEITAGPGSSMAGYSLYTSPFGLYIYYDWHYTTAITPGAISLYDYSTGSLLARLDGTGLQFYDPNGTERNFYPAVTAQTAYWHITQTGWRVRSTPDDTISTNIIGTATNGANYKYLGTQNGWINIYYSSSYPSAWIGSGSGQIIYQ